LRGVIQPLQQACLLPSVVAFEMHGA
jgi:hypothetical protein